MAAAAAAGEGREGDWECNGCNNRNYAFRSFCNRCKQPRLLVDAKTPLDSKWFPRFGDWICTGCTNNNYASREKCQKCGLLKKVAAIPAIAMSGVLPNTQAGLPPGMVFTGSSIFQQSMPSSSNWSVLHGQNNLDQFAAFPKGWRNGDWLCNCGFHNYSSRTECKQCNAAPPALGVKRLATDDPVHDWENKRQNAGCGPFINQYMQSSCGFAPGFIGDHQSGLCSPYPGGSATVPPSMQGPMQLAVGPTLTGNRAKHWRDGDWVCSKCSNHNYASRMECNRCKTQKAAISQPVGVA